MDPCSINSTELDLDIRTSASMLTRNSGSLLARIIKNGTVDLKISVSHNMDQQQKGTKSNIF